MAGTPAISGIFSSAVPSSKYSLIGDYTLSISGTFVATIDFERSFDDGATWHIVESYTAPTESNIEARGHGIDYRLNCSAYTSGSALYRIQR